jgi:hypothetical protein
MDGEVHKSKNLQSLLLEKISQTAKVSVGNDHQVAARIGIAVHCHEATLSLVDNQFIATEGVPAKDAAFPLFSPDIGDAPRSKDSIHLVNYSDML